MRAANLTFLFLAWLLVLVSTLPATTAKPALHRRHLHSYTSLSNENSHARHLLQSCNSCPATATASATCSAASTSQLNTIRADLISKCSSTAFNPSRCCELYASSNWNTYAACACSDTIAGLSAFVDGSVVMNACGCGPASTTTSTTLPSFIGRSSSSNQSGSTSSSIDMAAVYSAVTFSNNNNNNGVGSGNSGSGGSTSGGGSGSGTSTGGDESSRRSTSPPPATTP